MKCELHIQYSSCRLIIGSQHIVSFDNVFIDLYAKHRVKTCSYLLAHDFVSNQFTLILKNEGYKNSTRNYLVFESGDDFVELELGSPLGSIRSKSNITILPQSFGELNIIRELSEIIITSKRGVRISCNLEFDLCSIQLSGW